MELLISAMAISASKTHPSQQKEADALNIIVHHLDQGFVIYHLIYKVFFAVLLFQGG